MGKNEIMSLAFGRLAGKTASVPAEGLGKLAVIPDGKKPKKASESKKTVTPTKLS